MSHLVHRFKISELNAPCVGGCEECGADSTQIIGVIHQHCSPVYSRTYNLDHHFCEECLPQGLEAYPPLKF